MLHKTARVAAGIIWKNSKILICQRPAGKKRGLLWEFPGGKIDEGESPQDALKRELREELDMEIQTCELVARESYAYPDLEVSLLFYSCVAAGAPRMLEHADMRWIHPSQAKDFAFCPADEPVLQKLAAGVIREPEGVMRREDDG